MIPYKSNIKYKKKVIFHYLNGKDPNPSLPNFKIEATDLWKIAIKNTPLLPRTSWKDLGLLFSLVLMGMLVFGSLTYYIENEEPDTGFYSIPQVPNRAARFTI